MVTGLELDLAMTVDGVCARLRNGWPAAIRVSAVPLATATSREVRNSLRNPEVGREVLLLLTVVAVTFKSKPRAVVGSEPLLQLNCTRAELSVGGEDYGHDDGRCRAAAT